MTHRKKVGGVITDHRPKSSHLRGDDASRRVTDFDPGGVHLESNHGLSSVGERIVKDEFDGGAVGRQADQRRLRQTVLILVNGINVEPQRIWKAHRGLIIYGFSYRF